MLLIPLNNQLYLFYSKITQKKNTKTIVAKFCNKKLFLVFNFLFEHLDLL